MKTFLSITFSLTLFFLADAQQSTTSYTTSKGDVHLLGTIARSQLNTASYQDWYNSIYENYVIPEEQLTKVNQHHDGAIKIEVYLGTWCGDSKREVTRFLKLVDHSDINENQVKLICLDARTEAYKQGPNGEEKGLNIHRVPTFIFKKDGEEIGRIVESPVSSLETDIAQIFAGLPTKPNYKVANYLLEQFKLNTTEELNTLIEEKGPYLRRLAKNEGELNTLGYVLLSAKNYEEAIMAFKLNTLMYPQSGNVFDSLAEAHLKAGNTDLAAANYLKSLQLDAGNENALAVLQELASSKND